jgi:hypothetical protein
VCASATKAPIGRIDLDVTWSRGAADGPLSVPPRRAPRSGGRCPRGQCRRHEAVVVLAGLAGEDAAMRRSLRPDFLAVSAVKRSAGDLRSPVGRPFPARPVAPILVSGCTFS